MLPIEIERIAGDIRRVAETHGAELVDIQFRRMAGRSVLTVLADKTGGISLDDCAAINRALREFVDGGYVVEVNSPGLDRPLKTERDWARAHGENLRVVWRESETRVLELRGRLSGLENGVVRLENPPAGEVSVPLASVIKAVRDVKIQ